MDEKEGRKGNVKRCGRFFSSVEASRRGEPSVFERSITSGRRTSHSHRVHFFFFSPLPSALLSLSRPLASVTTNCTGELVNQPDVGIINTNGRC